MFNFFKKKKLSNNKDKVQQKSNSRHIEASTYSYFFNTKDTAGLKQTKFNFINKWCKEQGDFVNIGEDICEISTEDYSIKIKSIDAKISGFLEIHKPNIKKLNEFNIEKPIPIYENEKLFTIHKELSKEQKQDLKKLKFKNVPKILFDKFTDKKEIKWEIVAGRYLGIYSGNNFNDTIVLCADDKRNGCIYITFYNIDSKDYLAIRYWKKYFKITPHSKISFLFENKNVIEFKPPKQSYLFNSDSDFGHIYETTIPISFEDLELFKNNKLTNWQITFQKSNKKINGSINKESQQFSVTQLSKDYCEIVNIEIENYKPLLKKDIISEKDDKSIISECYVYIMIDLANNYYKIGISNQPTYREKTLQSEKPTIQLLASKKFPIRKIAVSFEQALHNTYADKRIRGEWFELDENDVKVIIASLS